VICLRSRMPACISVAAVLTWDDGGQRAIVRPLSGDPCLYLRFPLIAPHDIGLPVPIDGPFAVDENRTTVFIGGETKEGVANESLIDRGLELMLQLISYLASDGVSGVRYLMQIPRLAEGEDLQWWDPKLARLAYTLSNLPAVPTHQGELLPARSAAFVVGRVVVDDPVPSVDITAVWNLLRALHLPVPRLEEAKDWEKTVLEWRALEVDVPLYSVASIVEIVRGTRTLAGLEDKLKMDESGAIAWLRSLLDLLATATPNPDALLDGILPNQLGVFTPLRSLKIDLGVPDELKETADALGMNLRRELLLNSVLFGEPEGESARRLLVEQTIDAHMSAADAAHRIADEAYHVLLNTSKAAESKAEDRHSGLHASIRLLLWLASSELPDAKDIALRVPLLTADDTAEIGTGTEPILLPPGIAWPPDAAVHRDVFPAKRLLADSYKELAAERYSELAGALCRWGLMHPALVINQVPKNPTLEVFKELAIDPVPEDRGHRWNIPGLSTIPFFSPEVIGRIGQDRDRAQHFLSLLLNHITAVDDRWLTKDVRTCRAESHNHGVTIIPSAWLAEVRFRAWVPIPGEGGTTATRPPIKGEPGWSRGLDADSRGPSRRSSRDSWLRPTRTRSQIPIPRSIRN
jgi:hypothetical protein